jgi:F-type H+-transporting ATPase subunit gamma
MPSLKEYKNKLASLSNTRKITKTMKMVAASKLYRTMDAQRRAYQFYAKLEELLGRLAASVDHRAHPLLQARAHPKSALVILYMSDKGLCGGFNNNLIKHMTRWLNIADQQVKNISLSFVGRRGWLFFRNRMPVAKLYEGAATHPTPGEAVHIAEDAERGFLDGTYDEVYLAYNHFVNPLSQTPVIKKLLPIEPHVIQAAATGVNEDFLLEPAQHELLGTLLPQILNFEVYFALLENAAGENGARMTAMDSATNNANKMIKQYTLLRNRARQASITKELIEIVSGAEALKG